MTSYTWFLSSWTSAVLQRSVVEEVLWLAAESDAFVLAVVVAVLTVPERTEHPSGCHLWWWHDLHRPVRRASRLKRAVPAGGRWGWRRWWGWWNVPLIAEPRPPWIPPPLTGDLLDGCAAWLNRWRHRRSRWGWSCPGWGTDRSERGGWRTQAAGCWTGRERVWWWESQWCWLNWPSWRGLEGRWGQPTLPPACVHMKEEIIQYN